MEKDIMNLNDKIYSNMNYIFLEVVNDLQLLINNLKNDLIIKALEKEIIKINNLINENKKNNELIKNNISEFYAQTQKKFDELKINNINNQEIQCENGRYIGKLLMD